MTLALDFPAFGTVRSKSCCLEHPVYGIWVWSPGWTKTVAVQMMKKRFDFFLKIIIKMITPKINSWEEYRNPQEYIRGLWSENQQSVYASRVLQLGCKNGSMIPAREQSCCGPAATRSGRILAPLKFLENNSGCSWICLMSSENWFLQFSPCGVSHFLSVLYDNTSGHC